MLAQRITDLGMPLATISDQIADRIRHGRQIDPVNALPPRGFDIHQPRLEEDIEVGGQVIARYLDGISDLARRHACRSRRHNRPEHAQTNVMRESGKPSSRIVVVHYIVTSIILESLNRAR